MTQLYSNIEVRNLDSNEVTIRVIYTMSHLIRVENSHLDVRVDLRQVIPFVECAQFLEKCLLSDPDGISGKVLVAQFLDGFYLPHLSVSTCILQHLIGIIGLPQLYIRSWSDLLVPLAQLCISLQDLTCFYHPEEF